jgi:hypothetical protein
MQFRKALVMALVVLGTSAFLLPLMVSAASWSSPFALGSGGLKPAVAVDDTGAQHYVWWTTSGKIQYSKCTGQGGNGCSSPENLPTNGASYYPSIALDPQGRPNVVFESKVSDGNSYAVFWTRKQGSGWASLKKISSEPYSEIPDIAIGPGGTIHVIYQSKQDSTGYVYYTKSNGGFDFDAPEALDTADSDAPIAEFGLLAEQGKAPEAMEGNQLSNGLYPRIAADQNDNAHAAWNLPGPNYGIKYRYQNNGNWQKAKTAGSGQKDQTPDITVAPNGSVGIIWGTYDDFNAAFAEFTNGSKDNSVNDIDGGLAQSLWPKISADCAGKFHFVFQGSVGTDSKWNIYHREYNPANNTLGGRETIANLSQSEQTPAVDSRSVIAVVYTQTTNGIIDASTANLNLNCSSATATPTFTPTITNTPDPNATPTMTPTPTNTPGDAISIANTAKCPSYDGTEEGCIHYRKTWKKVNDSKATNGNYQRCENSTGVCSKSSAAKIIVPGGYTKVKWFTAKALTYGIAKVWINDQLVETLDMCQGNNGIAPKFVNLTYNIPDRNDGQPRTFEIGAPSKKGCSPYNSNFVVIDGFEIQP